MTVSDNVISFFGKIGFDSELPESRIELEIDRYDEVLVPGFVTATLCRVVPVAEAA